MGIYDKMKPSERLEKEGVWLDLGECRILCAFAGNSNTAFLKEAAAINKQYGKLQQAGMLPHEKDVGLMRELFASTVVKDWETKTGEDDNGEPTYTQGIEGPNGDLLPVTKENIVLTFKNIPALLTAVREHSMTGTFYLASLIEKTAKN